MQEISHQHMLKISKHLFSNSWESPSTVRKAMSGDTVKECIVYSIKDILSWEKLFGIKF